jgi:hypothetical protein
LRELLQILFYGNSALGNSLPYLSCVDFCRVRPAGRTLFLRLVLQSMASHHTPHKAKHFLRTENNSHLFCGWFKNWLFLVVEI